MNYTDDFKDQLDELLFTLVTTYIDNEVPFRLIINSDDVWDKPLPAYVLDNDSNGLISLDVHDQSLEDSYYDLETDKIIMTTGFDGIAYTRSLDIYDIVGIIDLANKTPVMLKPYISERPTSGSKSSKKTIEGILKSYDVNEITEGVVTSLSIMKHYNPQFFEDEPEL